MHLKRLLTSIIAIPILIYVIGPNCPRWVFYSVLFVVAIIGLMEFYNITAPDLPRRLKIFSYLLSLLLFLGIFCGQYMLTQVIIVLFAFAPLTFFMFTLGSRGNRSTMDVGKAVTGPIYIVIPLSMIMYIDRHSPVEGHMWIFFLLIVIFASDTGAFYCGRFFGRHKLYELISPKKTWEGAIGGILCSLMAALCFLYLLLPQRISSGIFVLIVVLSIAGQIGDLVESMLKRNHNKKDSGTILPGHGGVLDRIDGLLFAVPILFAYINCCTF